MFFEPKNKQPQLFTEFNACKPLFEYKFSFAVGLVTFQGYLAPTLPVPNFNFVLEVGNELVLARHGPHQLAAVWSWDLLWWFQLDVALMDIAVKEG